MLVHLCSSSLHAQQVAKFYIDDKKGNDYNNGSKNYPWKTITKAKLFTAQYRNPNCTLLKFILAEGNYVITEPLQFAPENGGSAFKAVEYFAEDNKQVTVTGAITLTSRWKRIYGSQIYELDVSKLPVFRTLYKNDSILKRSSSPYFKTVKSELGNITIPRYDFKLLNTLSKKTLNPFLSISYDKNEIKNPKDMENSEIIVYNSWEASWHSVAFVDTINEKVYFKNPLFYPVGFFGSQNYYRVENSKAFLKEGTWFLDNKAKKLYYKAIANENPNEMDFKVPVLTELLILKGNKKRNLEHLKFNGITFKYTAGLWGKTLFSSQFISDNLKKYSYLKATDGYLGTQGAFNCGQAIMITYSNNIVFENCKFENLGGYGLNISDYSFSNSILNGYFNKCGGGGIILGLDKPGAKLGSLPSKIVPTNNKIINNLIENCGLFYLSSVGIAVLQSNHNNITGNTIRHMPYSGISVGWSWNDLENYTFNNEILNNNISNVIEELGDGGGIYTLGNQKGSLYWGNHIHNIKRNIRAIGGSNNGMFFDEGSSDFTVEKNVVEEIGGNVYKFNKSDKTRLKFQNNNFN